MFFALAGVAAVLNWVAVERDNERLEYVAKPATTALLVAATVALTPHSSAERAWFVAALLFCLAGDVFLMLPRDAFVPGLASFFVGHVCFVVGFFASGLSAPFVPTGIAALAIVPVIARPIVRGARAQDPALVAPVLAYMTVLVALVTIAGPTRSWWAIAGSCVFVTSDFILARNRFVRPFAHAHLATMVTYHAALALLVLSLR